MYVFKISFAGALLASVIGAGVEAAQGVVRGVNAGGWLVTEPWLTPSLFGSTASLDEWHLCERLGKDECYKTLNKHWSTFYTRDDFVQIKNAGLTAVRIPLGYWAVVSLLPFEPYVSGQYPYLVQAVQWAGELGLNVMIDIHGAPGSQNGWEESGIVGPIEFPANQSNSDRTLDTLRNLTTEFSKSQYKGAVTNIELLNEPIFDSTKLKDFYKAGFNVVSPANASGINVTIHDAFYNPSPWKNYDPNNPGAEVPAQHLTLDTHQFWAFPPLSNLSTDEILQQLCTFGQQLKAVDSHIPPTLVGEWSLDTGYTANSTSNTEQDQAKRTWYRKLFEAQNAAFTPSGPGQASIGWYYWAWKTEYDIDAWSYRKGLSDQYIPSNVSNSSTYVFPIMPNGCIDPTFNYTAPVLVTSSALPTGTASPTGSGGNPDSSSGTTTKKSSASSLALDFRIAHWLAMALAFFMGIL